MIRAILSISPHEKDPPTKIFQISLKTISIFVFILKKVQRIKKSLDPFETGKIDFDQFVLGIQKLTNEEEPQQQQQQQQDEHNETHLNDVLSSSSGHNDDGKSIIDFFDGKSNEVS